VGFNPSRVSQVRAPLSESWPASRSCANQSTSPASPFGLRRGSLRRFASEGWLAKA